MGIIHTWLTKLRLLLANYKKRTSRQSARFPTKRFPFIWLCLVLIWCPAGYCQENLKISFEAVSAEHFAELAVENFFSLPTQKIAYASYPFIIRPTEYGPMPEISVELKRNWQNSTGTDLPEASVSWSAATWVWEGREEHGPAPGLQFTALIPLLTEPGIYTATVWVYLTADGVTLESFPLDLSLTVPAWAACRVWPQQLKIYQKGLGKPGRELIESEHLRFIIAANTDWSLWIQPKWLPERELIAQGTGTLHSKSGYLLDTYRLRKEFNPNQSTIPTESTLELLLRY